MRAEPPTKTCSGSAALRQGRQRVGRVAHHGVDDAIAGGGHDTHVRHGAPSQVAGEMRRRVGQHGVDAPVGELEGALLDRAV